ncbi:collagen alpha-2(I) chain-like [Passer montanus]|uniref:collagen alpha-2(I) chain-like n=1 Tax=Passer montanus TaxID=9160 RepID=UPI00195F93CE|nr:collagen alpha-2(I) chain-like [Passer montanus]
MKQRPVCPGGFVGQGRDGQDRAELPRPPTCWAGIPLGSVWEGGEQAGIPQGSLQKGERGQESQQIHVGKAGIPQGSMWEEAGISNGAGRGRNPTGIPAERGKRAGIPQGLMGKGRRGRNPWQIPVGRAGIPRAPCGRGRALRLCPAPRGPARSLLAFQAALGLTTRAGHGKAGARCQQRFAPLPTHRGPEQGFGHSPSAAPPAPAPARPSAAPPWRPRPAPGRPSPWQPLRGEGAVPLPRSDWCAPLPLKRANPARRFIGLGSCHSVMALRAIGWVCCQSITERGEPCFSVSDFSLAGVRRARGPPAPPRGPIGHFACQSKRRRGGGRNSPPPASHWPAPRSRLPSLLMKSQPAALESLDLPMLGTFDS